jgi:hypothetical protein
MTGSVDDLALARAAASLPSGFEDIPEVVGDGRAALGAGLALRRRTRTREAIRLPSSTSGYSRRSISDRRSPA